MLPTLLTLLTPAINKIVRWNELTLIVHSLAADPATRFITTSFLGLFMDICIMQPGRVVVVAVIMVMIHTDLCYSRYIHTYIHTYACPHNCPYLTFYKRKAQREYIYALTHTVRPHDLADASKR
jgi:hypothetical protein